jgi:hypothetical protein
MGVRFGRSNKKEKGGFTHSFVAMDKYIKWIKVKSVASIIAAKAMESIREIMHDSTCPITSSLIMRLSSL